MNTLYRVFVGLPAFMCERDRPMQERTVFFEAPYDYASGSNAGAAEVLEKLLTLAWGVDASGWCEEGFAYNLRRAREILDEAMGEGDSRLLEIGWGGPERISYARAEDVDLFVTPRQNKRIRAALEQSLAVRFQAARKALGVLA
ncbi:hypothetical protein EH244_27050 [Variovorax beijingensis]|uniref:Uncharacterized protein n=1 Tax=Variovorax beijingensis TaxID=2496117 RepID=A0A3P3E759_9BURK|nr:hypothetical protein [Variovorax beijingensis]RRH82310.1 hypothetical protein EH244_27050 [Variovorax beijingensis]